MLPLVLTLAMTLTFLGHVTSVFGASPTRLVDPYNAQFILGNMKIYWHFISFPSTEMAQVYIKPLY